MASALHGGKRTMARGLRPKQKSYTLLRELGSRFSRLGDLVVDFVVDPLADSFSATVARFKALCHQLFVRYKLNTELFRLAKEILLRQSAKAAVDGGANVRLSGEDLNQLRRRKGWCRSWPRLTRCNSSLADCRPITPSARACWTV